MTNGTRGGLHFARVRLDTKPDDVDWLAAFGADPSMERFYWCNPSEATTLLGLGCARLLEAEGAGRFADVAAAARDLWRVVEVSGDEGPADRGPQLLGGFGFADRPSPQEGPWRGFGAGRWVLPEALLVGRDGELWLSVCGDSEAGARAAAAPWLSHLVGRPASAEAVPESDFDCAGPAGMAPGPEYRVRADRSHADYLAQVDAARRGIAAGDLQKVVLARSLQVRHDGRFDVAGLLERLQELYPECATFAIAPAPLAVPASLAVSASSVIPACFVGATPELLVGRCGDRVRSSALAGSAPRGRTPRDDARHGRELRESKKENEEHALVVRAIVESLTPLCDRLDVAESPRLLRLQGIQHLHTPIEGVLRPGSLPSLFELGARLHPTPAVAGSPRRAALDWIDRFEGLDRGWYAAPVGFVGPDGAGELRVALRSALLRQLAEGDEARLFAGGGILADSDPDRELEETRIKLRALLAPLTEI